ncbi:MAG: hypothetical protein FWD68_16440 [Alphaproteobacteria bacterium]|nr:hypothetical protein [Alphaproteobacteria bacterium]
MSWIALLCWFLAGAFLANAVPHFVSGVMGRPFQSPFARPPGEGLSSSVVNVAWGFANFIAFYLLAFQVGTFDLHNILDIGVFALGALGMALFCARHFGRFHGGNMPA